jgi:nucleotide-binding universal stress UspA family protein
MYKYVLIALDGSAQAARAIPEGLEIARQLGAVVVLLRVLTPQGGLAGGKTAAVAASNGSSGLREYAAQRAQAQGYLDAMCRSLRTSGVRIQARLEDGDPATVIASVARSLEKPIVVITPNGKSASLSDNPEGVFGRVADEVLRLSPGPVLVAKS